MFRGCVLLVLVLVLTAPAAAQTRELIVPAGTLLQCTLGEPRFSSKTATVGDPVLCHLGPLRIFGRSAFPRGAYLSGRLRDYRDPGHFFGKGWLRLEFDRLFLPGAVIPLAARVIAVPRYNVDVEGKIRGRGHPWRDALGWAIPVLWPLKIITLPMRGPRPTLKGEVRILLRLLDDVSMPSAALAALQPPTRPRAPSRSTASTAAIFSPRIRYVGSNRGAAMTGLPVAALRRTIENSDLTQSVSVQAAEPEPEQELTIVMVKGGRGYAVTEYWIEDSQLRYVATDGARGLLPLEEIDLPMTVQLNQERGVAFVLRTRSAVP